MKTSNTNKSNSATGKKTGISGMSSTEKPKSAGRGRKKKSVDDFDDLNMRLDTDVQDETPNNWGRSRRANYRDDEDADSYEGTGFGRSRFGYDGDEDLNDPYETFRRG